MSLFAAGCLEQNAWICGEYLSSRSDKIIEAVREHVGLTVGAVAYGTLLAIPLVLAARRWRVTAGWIGGFTNVLYTVPSLAFFAMLLPFTGLSGTTVLVGLVAYTLVILFRGFLTGLDGVPPEVRQAATGMGYGPIRLLLTVELPLALPVVIAALRTATVSTVALVTVGAAVGHGGLGDLIYSGLGSTFKAEVLTASVLCVALAVAADLLFVLLERLLTPWRRGLRRGFPPGFRRGFRDGSRGGGMTAGRVADGLDAEPHAR